LVVAVGVVGRAFGVTMAVSSEVIQ
jgi:hypothetical protein